MSYVCSIETRFKSIWKCFFSEVFFLPKCQELFFVVIWEVCHWQISMKFQSPRMCGRCPLQITGPLLPFIILAPSEPWKVPRETYKHFMKYECQLSIWSKAEWYSIYYLYFPDVDSEFWWQKYATCSYKHSILPGCESSWPMSPCPTASTASQGKAGISWLKSSFMSMLTLHPVARIYRSATKM